MLNAEARIWLQAARDAINELLADNAYQRVPELLAMTEIPAKSKSLYEAIDDVLCVQNKRDADDFAPHP